MTKLRASTTSETIQYRWVDSGCDCVKYRNGTLSAPVYQHAAVYAAVTKCFYGIKAVSSESWQNLTFIIRVTT